MMDAMVDGTYIGIKYWCDSHCEQNSNPMYLFFENISTNIGQIERLNSSKKISTGYVPKNLTPTLQQRIKLNVYP